ncbi:Putative peptidoglycan binding domain-containing protein [Thalassococcus halodurans]|uniref:Putative peptidoglycan binding domain-containing protein n=1 Tax=Thalassococcus halodurans TaxID=373675 RepID=A0A1H5U8C6_9RHOB|nr:peptidoglycan-binding domain-containing protein [Thalassococcus halodurans]SEF71229.1 Putative peptidoglycan binding domain-containing protein [Thalassococcus halodurans]
MRKTILSAAALLWGTTAIAETDMLIVGNAGSSVMDRFRSGQSVEDLTDQYSAFGQVVSVKDAEADDMSRAALRFLTQSDSETDMSAVMLTGRFVTTGGETYLLPSTVSSNVDITVALTEGLPLSPLLAELAQHPGQALLMIGSEDFELQNTRLLTVGIGTPDLPQGVTMVTGTPTDIAGFAASLPRRSVVRLADSSDLSLRGYVPSDLTFFEEERETPEPQVIEVTSTDADEALWAKVSARSDLQGYEDYLSAFPNGLYADQARAQIEEIKAEPMRAERLAEEALNLSRDQRREIQRDLTLLEYEPRGIDGIFGPGSRAAIRRWQEANAFEVTSYLTREQITRLGAQADRRAAELEEEARQRQAEQERQDRAYWQETGALGDAAGFRAYLSRYPDGVYAEVAQERLAAIEAEAREQAAAQDRAAWDTAANADTIEAYQDYLRAFPQGAFADEAEARIEALQIPSDERRAIAQAEAQEAALNLPQSARRLAEARLKELGLKPGSVDGTFDDKTRRAIRRYQEARNITVTGYLDQQTVVRLLAGSLLR